MIWESYLDPESRSALRAFNQQPITAQQSTYDPALVDAMKSIQDRAPWLTPETSLALAKSFASNGAVDAVGTMAGQRSIDQQGANSQLAMAGMTALGTGIRYVSNAAGFGFHWLGKAVGIVPGALSLMNALGNTAFQGFQQLKTPIKYGTAALDLVPEMSNYLASKIAAPILAARGRPIEHVDNPNGGFWDQFSIGQLLHHPDESGSGYFLSEDLRQAQAREARARRGTINGSAFTLGRGAASLVFTPGSQAYANASGIVDIVWNLKLPDPTKLVTEGLEAFRDRKSVV